MMDRTEQTAAPLDAGEVEVVEIQREIARTQGAMGDTLDAIQEKLNPSALMEQARGPVEETTDHIVAEVQRAVRESAEQLIEHARGPIEEVSDHLITRATGALEEATERLVAQATAAVQETTDHILERARVTATEAAAEIVDHTGTALRAATIGKVEHMVGTMSETTRGMANGANEATLGLGATVRATIQANPLPAALAALGLGWLYLKRPKVAAGMTTTISYRAGGPTRPGAGLGYRPGGATPGDTAGHGAAGGRDTVGSTAGAVADTVGSAASAVADTLGAATDTVAGAVGGAASAMGDAVGTAGGAVGHAAGGTQEAARDLAAEVWYQAQRVGDGVQTLAHQNPLALGTAGIAVGALIGLAVPTTPQERQVMGAARDTLVDKALGTAQETLDTVGSIAQHSENAVESVIKTEAHVLTP